MIPCKVVCPFNFRVNLFSKCFIVVLYCRSCMHRLKEWWNDKRENRRKVAQFFKGPLRVACCDKLVMCLTFLFVDHCIPTSSCYIAASDTWTHTCGTLLYIRASNLAEWDMLLILPIHLLPLSSAQCRCLFNILGHEQRHHHNAVQPKRVR